MLFRQLEHWASIVPHTWIRTLGVPGRASVPALHDPFVTALMALVTTAAEPRLGGHPRAGTDPPSAGIGEMFGRPSTAADRLDQA
jgi:hypothetical protein